MRYIVFFLSLTIFLHAKSVDEIKGLQNSLAKDFFIYQVLKDESTTNKDAKELLSHVYRMNTKLEDAFFQKIKDKNLRFEYDCKREKLENFENLSDECLSFALTPLKAYLLSKNERLKIYARLKRLDDKKFFWLYLMGKDDIFSFLLLGENGEFLKVFLSLNKEQRKEIFDKKIPKKYLEKLSKNWRFERFVVTLAIDNAYPNLVKSILSQQYQNLTFKNYFYLAMLSLLEDKKSSSLENLRLAYHSAKKQRQKDKVLFWIYQISKDKKALFKLLKSDDFNLYASYAKEIFGKEYDILTPKPIKKSLKTYDISDPFAWEATKKNIKNLDNDEVLEFSEQFFTKDTLPYYIFLQKRAKGYKTPYIITPYEEYLKGLHVKRKALIYAIARQESRFIPVDVSTSYALGIMQFMPFLAKAIAKDERLEDFKLEDMFKPSISFKFANIHLNHLQTYLFNPLLVAYAYNGGIGFTRRMLKRRFKDGEFEPFLSMELVDREESREYGKKVLTNYVQYTKIYGIPFTLKGAFQNLKKPSASYRFPK